MVSDHEKIGHLFSILNYLPVGAFAIRKDYTVIFWNRRVANWTGICVEEIAGKSITEYYPGFDGSNFCERLAPVFRGGAPVLFSSIVHQTLLPSKLRDGQPRLQETIVTSVPLDGSDENIALFTIQDMTAFFTLLQNYCSTRDQALAEMRESRETGIEIQKVNQKLGRTVIQRTALLAASQERYRSLFENVPAAIFEMNYGKLRQYFQKNGISSGEAAVGHLSENPQHLENCLEMITIKEANKVGKALFGVSAAEAITPAGTLFRGAEARQAFAAQIRALVDHQNQFDAEFPITGDDTEPIYISLRAVTSPGSEKNWDRILVSIMDISVRKAAELTLRNAHEVLEKRVAQRTIMLSDANSALQAEIAERKAAENALNNILEELQRSNRDLEEFASIASHDLKEPLRKVTAFGERLKKHYGDLLGERGNDYLERMRSAAVRMQTLIDSLLILSRVTSKARPFQPVDLNGICAEVLRDLEIRIEQSVGKVNIAPLPTLPADPLQMRQLFQNLISNALKFHHPGRPPQVNISWTEESGENGDFYEIRVKDSGIGFDNQYLERIFKPFQRLHTRSAYEGTGMGLAVCRRIVERHNGSLIAESQPDIGSTFLIQLPKNQYQESGSADCGDL